MTPVRTIHHLSCSGGTMIAKCIAVSGNPLFLSEINPMGHQARTRFAPMDLLSQLEVQYGALTQDDREAYFRIQMKILNDISDRQARPICIRDHSHTSFLRKDPATTSETHTLLQQIGFPTLSIATVRHPLDAFAAMRASKWTEGVDDRLDVYCARVQAFKAYCDDAGIPLWRYEDFCADPVTVMGAICKALDLPLNPNFMHDFKGVMLTGGSGRSSDDISPRPRRPISEALVAEAQKSQAYATVCAALGYATDPQAPPLDAATFPSKAQVASPPPKAGAGAVLRFLRPKPCPYPLMRIGGTGDGAYLVPDDLQGIAACFSPGVNNFKHFEDALLADYGIASHMCDRSSDASRLSTPLVAGKQTFRKLWLDTTGADDAISLEEWVAELASGEDDLLLQIDIEGAEYRNILATDPAVLRRFRTIVIELHRLRDINDPDALARVLGPFCAKLDRDFVCVHAHPNNAAPQVEVTGTGMRVPNVLELTLLRKDRLEGHDSASLIAPQLPHPLDLGSNVPDRPPAFLDANWYDGPQSEVSRLKQAQETWTYRDAVDRRLRETGARISAELDWIFAAVERAGDVARLVPPQGASPVDLARGRPFRLNNGFRSHPTDGTVARRAPFFFHTAVDTAGNAITVDLQTPARLSEVVIANHTNKRAAARAANLVIVAHDESDPKSGAAYPLNPDADFLTGRALEARIDLDGVPARYVTVTSPAATALHFSDLRVMGVRV